MRQMQVLVDNRIFFLLYVKAEMHNPLSDSFCLIYEWLIPYYHSITFLKCSKSLLS